MLLEFRRLKPFSPCRGLIGAISSRLFKVSCLFYWYGSTLIPVWISNHTPNKMLDEITDPFHIFNFYTVWFWEWINNFIPDFTMDEISYSCRDENWTILVKWAPGVSNDKKRKKRISSNTRHATCMHSCPRSKRWYSYPQTSNITRTSVDNKLLIIQM